MGLFLPLMQRDFNALMIQKIKNFNGCAFAGNEKTLAFGELCIVNGFKFLTIKLVGEPKVHTFKGCQVRFMGEDKNAQMTVDSDTQEIDTDYSETLRMGITTFDIDLDESLEDAARKKILMGMMVIFGKTGYGLVIDSERLYKIVSSTVTDEDRYNPLG